MPRYDRDYYGYRPTRSEQLAEISSKLVGMISDLSDAGKSTIANLVSLRRETTYKPYSYSWDTDYREKPNNARRLRQTAAVTAMIGLIGGGLFLGYQERGPIISTLERFTSPVSSPSPTPSEIPTKTPVETATPLPTLTPEPTVDMVRNTYFAGSLSYTVDSQGLVNYTDPFGKEVSVNPDQYATLKKEALRTGHPQIISSWALTDEKSTKYKFSENDPLHPIFSELPQNILTDKQLAAHGLKIVGPQSDLLRIDADAFKPGGLFEDVTSKHPLDIVLLDGPIVSARIAVGAQYDPYRKLLEYQFPATVTNEDFRSSKITEFQTLLDQDLSNLEQASNSKDLAEISALNSFVADDMAWIEYYKSLSESDLNIEASLSDGSASGLFMDSDLTNSILGTNTGKAVIFACIGKKTTVEKITLFVDSQGHADATDTVSPGFDFTPQNQLSRPGPDNYHLNPGASKTDPKNKYPYGGQDANNILRHEDQHWKQSQKPYAQQDQNEFDVDTASMARIKKVYDAWVKNQDVTGLPLYWQLPDGRWVNTTNHPFRVKPSTF